MGSPTMQIPTTNTSNSLLLEEPRKYSDVVRVAALALGIPIIIFSVLGNLMTIIAVIKTKALRTGANIFILSLSVFDLMLSIIIIPTILTVIWNNGWVFSKVYCVANAALLILTGGGTLMSLSGTAVTRYLKIIHPKLFKLFFGRKHNIAITVCTFLSVPIWIVLPPVTGVWGKLGYDSNTMICGWESDNSGYNTFLMLYGLTIPILFTSFCYLRILCKVCSNRKKIQAARNGDGHRQAAMREDLRYTKMMISIFAVFLLSYMPHMINILIDPYAQNLTSLFFTMVCFWLSSCINPVLYGLLNRNFRKAFVNIYKDVKELTTVVTQQEQEQGQ